MNDLVSIVIPVYNMGDSIEKCVNSLCNQTYSNIEFILVDDGSKDDSFQICESLAEKDSRIKVYHTENQGSGPARNYGINHSSGKYIYFPDADDFVEPNAVDLLVKAMEGSNCDLVVFGYKQIKTDGTLSFEKIYKNEIKDCSVVRADYSGYMYTSDDFCIQGAPWNKFFKMELINLYNIRYPALRRHQDEGFIARYMCHAQSVKFISNVLYTYYANDLQLQWKKYPVDYIDAVIGLNNTRKETILAWNVNDQKTHDLITREYISNVIKALELSFSPKMEFCFRDRLLWIEDNIKKSSITDYHAPAVSNLYQKIMLFIIKYAPSIVVYFALHSKVQIEKIIR